MKGFQLLVVVSLAVVLVSSCPTGDPEKRLIKTSEKEPAQWMDQQEIWELVQEHRNFVDVTDHQFPDVKPEDVNTKAIPTTLKYQSVVQPLLSRVSIPRIINFVTAFSAYKNRYYQSATGVESEQWLVSQIRTSVAGYAGSLEVTEFTHSWAQNSVVVRITGSDPTLRNEVVIMGAHQDSINRLGATLAAPGADDNASGSAIVLETLRVIVEGGVIPRRTLEFHWYAAEEVGLRGSAAIAQSYQRSGVNVVGMVNLDVVGYQPAGRTEIGIYTDFTNAALSQFLRILVDQYCQYRWTNVRCGYGCSDHASWTNYGFPAAMPSEVVPFPNMHTLQDVIGVITFEQAREFGKLTLGYMIELGEPSA